MLRPIRLGCDRIGQLPRLGAVEARAVQVPRGVEGRERFRQISSACSAFFLHELVARPGDGAKVSRTKLERALGWLALQRVGHVGFEAALLINKQPIRLHVPGHTVYEADDD